MFHREKREVSTHHSLKKVISHGSSTIKTKKKQIEMGKEKNLTLSLLILFN